MTNDNNIQINGRGYHVDKGRCSLRVDNVIGALRMSLLDEAVNDFIA